VYDSRPVTVKRTYSSLTLHFPVRKLQRLRISLKRIFFPLAVHQNDQVKVSAARLPKINGLVDLTIKTILVIQVVQVI